jgi:altronate hydrolase
MAEYLRINPADNVAVALSELPAGSVAEFGPFSVTLAGPVPAGHKFTLKALAEGEDVIKYGFPIGHVTRAVPAGTHIDHGCIKTNLSGLLDYKYEPLPDIVAGQWSRSRHGEYESPRTFRGFRRPDGSVGVRNQIWIIPTVGCVNGICNTLAERLRAEKAGAMGSVDAIVPFPHNYGCSQLGDDHENTRTILADMVHHPNAGGVLVVSLGCENNQLDAFRGRVGDVDPARVRMIRMQDIAGDEIEAGMKELRGIFDACSKDEREDVPVSELRIGLKCGGSDGLSGITANPLLGRFSDWLVARGGTTVLTEVPEMFGAETILMGRAENEEVFRKTVKLINDFKDYYRFHGQTIYENPSPGNKEGGISTLEDKALGCTQKSGFSPVRDVLGYGEELKKPGLNLLSAPGNDLVASTALVLSGAQIILFTTGRGTPFSSPVPTVKISSNSALAGKKINWIDFDAGRLTEGKTVEAMGTELFNFVRSVAGGRRVKSENTFRDLAIFKTGVTL